MSSIGRIFFPLLPVVPDDLMAKAKASIAIVSRKSTAEEFSCIAEALEADGSKVKQAPGGKGDEGDNAPKKQVGNFLLQFTNNRRDLFCCHTQNSFA